MPGQRFCTLLLLYYIMFFCLASYYTSEKLIQYQSRSELISATSTNSVCVPAVKSKLRFLVPIITKILNILAVNDLSNKMQCIVSQCTRYHLLPVNVQLLYLQIVFWCWLISQLVILSETVQSVAAYCIYAQKSILHFQKALFINILVIK